MILNQKYNNRQQNYFNRHGLDFENQPKPNQRNLFKLCTKISEWSKLPHIFSLKQTA